VIEDTLRTMNVWLAITAVVTVVEVLLAMALVIGGSLVYRRVMVVAGALDRKQAARLVSRVSAILDDVNGVTTRVRERAEGVDRAISSAVSLVSQAGRRVEVNLRPSGLGAFAVLVGTLAAFATILRSRNEYAADPRPPM